MNAFATDTLLDIRDMIQTILSDLRSIKEELVEQNKKNQKVLEEQRAITRERAF